MKKLIILFVFFALQLQAQNSNLSIVSGATSGGTWSPLLSAATTGTTYTFTPNADNATVSVTEIDDLLRVKYSHVIINTVCSACTQTGQIDFNTALSSYNQNGVLNSKTLTFNASADVNIGNPVTLRSTTTYAGNLGFLSLVINTPGNINVTAEILLNNTSEVGSSVILTQGGSVTLNSTAGSVKVTGNINCSGTNNTTNSGLYNGTGGSITIKGPAGVSISGSVVSTSRINYAGAITVLDGNATVTTGGANDGISGVMNGGAFKKMGSGTLKLSGTNNAVSSSELAEGTLQLAGGTALPDFTTLTFTGANTTLDLNGVSESIGSIASSSGYGKVTSSVAGNITLTLGLSNQNTVYTGLMEDGLGVLSLAKYGEYFSLGNSVNNTANTYSGITTIYAGTLSIYNSRSLGSTSGGTVVRGTGKLALYNNINVGAEDLTLNLNGVSLSNVSGDNTYGGAISLGQNTTINSTAGTLTLTQTMTGTNVSLATTGAGSLTLSGTLTLGTGGISNNMGVFSLYSANNYSGATTVSSGILHIRNSGALGSSAVTVALGGSLQLQGGIVVSNALSLNGTGPLGTGALQSVAGINAVSGTITLTGDTRINADLNSSLTLNSNISAGAIALTAGGAGNVLLNGSLSGNGSLAYTWGTSPIQLNVATSLIKDGTGSLTLNSVNSYTGATVLSGGFVILGASEVIANTSAFLFNGGSLRTGGFSETVGNVSLLANGSTIELGANAHTLRFGPRQYLDYKMLTIKGWLGTAGSAGTGGRIFIEPSPLLRRSEYEQLKFTYYATLVN
ncbi:MAG: beta strand repeat-containing protein, partial [Aquirufa sp.]